MDDDAAAKDDIEDCSESEGDVAAPPPAAPAAHAPQGVAAHLASYCSARQSEGGRPPASHVLLDGEEAEEDVLGFSAEAGQAPLDIDVPLSQPQPPPRDLEDDLEIDASEAFTKTLPDEDVPNGTLSGGPADAPTLGDDFEDALPATPPPPLTRQISPDESGRFELGEAAAAPAFLARPDVAADAEDSEASSGAEDLAEGPALEEEPWASRPAAEREMWERVRPRALRREAARVKQLRFPVSVMSRLMRMHPDLQTKSSEASEVINYATVLMLQATVRAAVRGRKAGHTVRIEDLRQACTSNRELQFMLPLAGTLDASALTVSRSDADAEAAQVAGARKAGKDAGPGQSTLSSSLFARASGPPLVPAAAEDDAEAAEALPLDVVTVQGNLAMQEAEENLTTGAKGELTPEKQPPSKPPSGKQPREKQSGKRKQPAAGKKAGNKAPRVAATTSDAPVVTAPKAGGIASFFRRADANPGREDADAT